MLINIKFIFRRFFPNIKKLNYVKEQIGSSKGPFVFLMSTPLHKNLGDQAIALSERVYLEENYSQYKIVEIPTNMISHSLKYLKQKVIENSENLIFVHGGGNLGNFYPIDEFFRRKIVKEFPTIKIVSFPQSILFTNDKDGVKDLKKAQEIYQSNNNWNFIARETITYKKIRGLFPSNKTYLLPDIVLYLGNKRYSNLSETRNGVITLLRSDKEKVINNDLDSKIQKLLISRFDKVTKSDTIYELDKDISIENRESILIEKWKEISSYQLVVTDRLHGMIFAYLTKTPAIVLRNNNPKIETTYYNWLDDCKYIELIDDSSNLEVIIKNLQNNNSFEYSLEHEFSDLATFNSRRDVKNV